jgi:uncharacterized protein YecE (DUF72 family)
MTDQPQLALFGALEGDESESGASEFTLMSPPDGLRDVPLYLGTSSWNFAGWAGLVYPEGIRPEQLRKTSLSLYARHPLFGAVGVDRTYYRPVTARQFAEYAEQVPDDFRFIVKAHREISTPPEQMPRSARAPLRERFLDAEYAARVVAEPAAIGLGHKCGGIVFQFPPLRGRLGREPVHFAGRLNAFFAALPAGPTYFAEIRNPDLYTEAYFAALKDAGALHCYTVHPGAPSIAEQRRISGEVGVDGVLVRWNLRRDRRYEEAREAFAPFNRLVAEDLETRLEIADLISEAFQTGKRAIVLANNKAEGSAPLTLQKLSTVPGLTLQRLKS